MSLPRTYLAIKLTALLHTSDGAVLATIGDACRYMTGIGKQRELRQWWQRACQLILDRAAPAEITRQLKFALFNRITGIAGVHIITLTDGLYTFYGICKQAQKLF